MSKKRLFKVLIAVALVTAVALTVRDASATANIQSREDVTKGANIVACASLPSRYSLHTEYVKERGIWVAYTEDGPAGVDGGLIELLSNYRTCSK